MCFFFFFKFELHRLYNQIERDGHLQQSHSSVLEVCGKIDMSVFIPLTIERVLITGLDSDS